MTIFVGVYSGKISVYEPPTKNIHVDISKVETGNHLIGMSEINIILLLMVVGVFIIVR